MIVFEEGDVVDRRFRLEEKIGQGGMGQVWRATQLALGREVALKLILPGVLDDERFRTMFLEEAQISSRLSHPNIVPVVDSGEAEKGILWLAQTFVHGQDLSKVMRGSPRGLPLPIAGYIATQILLGLQAAHENHVIHRDLKPGNVLVSHAGGVLITDFGIAKVMTPGVTPTISTVLKGSPGYLAPEILRGQAPRPASDLFSLGALLHELLSGANPFSATSQGDRESILYATVNHEVPTLASLGIGVPPGLDGLIQNLVAKDPAARPVSAAQALEELYDVLAPVAREATAPSLRRFLAATVETVIARPAGSTGTRDKSGSTKSFGPSQMAGQALTAAGKKGSRARRAAVASLGAAAMVLLGVAGTLALSRSSSSSKGAAPAATEPTPIAAPPAPSHPDAGPPADARAAVAPDAGTPQATPSDDKPAHKRQRPANEGPWLIPSGRARDNVPVRP